MNPLIFSKVFDLLPGWVWALLLGAALMFGWWQYDDARSLESKLMVVNSAIAEQKIEAGHVLLNMTLQRNAAETALLKFRVEREIVDASNQAASTASGLALGSLATPYGGRLLDPKASGRWTSGCAAANGSAPTASNSGPGAAEAPGLLSQDLTELLQREASTNDEVNDAYASCRADTLNLRAKIAEYNAKLVPP